ncbi:unnamed protein product [Eruca vesicaria subsp. sativa]|uniref:Uncharacterized protein n=1 Tax=Eruca vesicaria subsp. sativa TaxID=29727 RepID=A0ABC8LZ87_ERUVS|nr:unnamed protein product [Eruca vesicaria subsp. sativa]
MDLRLVFALQHNRDSSSYSHSLDFILLLLLDNRTPREPEDHLFKWEDEAILDEVRIVDAKHQDLLHDLQSLSNTVLEELARQEASIGKLK